MPPKPTRPAANGADCVRRIGNASTLRLDETQAAQQAATFKALGHPIRVQIVDILSRYDEVCVCEIEQHFSLTQPTISHHLKVLREAGIIDGDQRGLWVYYRLLPGTLDALRALVNAWP
jgi:ArsR family transcriptional regulator